MHRRNREHPADRLDHALVNADVALDPLRAHYEPGAELACLADPIAGTHTGTLRHRVNRDVHEPPTRMRSATAQSGEGPIALK